MSCEGSYYASPFDPFPPRRCYGGASVVVVTPPNPYPQPSPYPPGVRLSYPPPPGYQTSPSYYTAGYPMPAAGGGSHPYNPAAYPSMAPSTQFIPVGQSVTVASSQQVLWEPDCSRCDCTACHRRFSFFFRRHHCRNCGRLFCDDCSTRFVALPHRGYHHCARVCDGCYGQVAATSTSH